MAEPSNQEPLISWEGLKQFALTLEIKIHWDISFGVQIKGVWKLLQLFLIQMGQGGRSEKMQRVIWVKYSN